MQLLLASLCFVGAFILVDVSIIRATQLPQSGYHNPLLIHALAQRIGLVSIILVLVGIGLSWKIGNLLTPWSAFEHGQSVRVFMLFLAVIMAWPMTTFGYNHFYDQSHIFDRLLIWILVALFWLRPVFIFPLVAMIFVMMWQFKQPDLNGSIIAHKLQVLHVLNLFATFMLIHMFSGYRRTRLLIFLTCCLVAAAYWVPALAKWQLGWLEHGHLYRLPLAAYAHGWLSFMPVESIIKFAHFIRDYDAWMGLSVLLFEAGFLLFFWRRWLAIVLLICIILFHLGVFALYGFFFWTWILLDAALLTLILKDKHANQWPLFNSRYLIVGALLIGFASLWAKPPVLGWFDTRLSYSYEVQGITEDGEKIILSSEFFAPYEDAFTMGAFSYLQENHNSLVGPYAVTKSKQIADALQPVPGFEELKQLEHQLGKLNYHAEHKDNFIHFIQQFVQHFNSTGPTTNFRLVAPPRQFWSHRGETVRRPVRFKHITVTEITWLYDEKTLKVMRKVPVAQIPIPVL